MKRALLIVGFVSGVTGLSAQAPAPTQSGPAFEVASVKPGAPDWRFGGHRVTPGGHWSSQNSTVVEIMQQAHPEFSFPGGIVGGPRWSREARFTINARASGAAPLVQLQAMARHLLWTASNFAPI
jgi:uncharacterized protein (TIGR03435 family)